MGILYILPISQIEVCVDVIVGSPTWKKRLWKDWRIQIYRLSFATSNYIKAYIGYLSFINWEKNNQSLFDGSLS